MHLTLRGKTGKIANISLKTLDSLKRKWIFHKLYTKVQRGSSTSHSVFKRRKVREDKEDCLEELLCNLYLAENNTVVLFNDRFINVTASKKYA